MRVRLATPNTPGAVAVIELTDAPDHLLSQLTTTTTTAANSNPNSNTNSNTTTSWPIGKLRYAMLADIDDGLIGRVSDELTWIMPHGGPRVVQKLVNWLIDQGAQPTQTLDPQTAYPEAQNSFQAHALALIAQTPSPAGVNVLLQQAHRWQHAHAHAQSTSSQQQAFTVVEPNSPHAAAFNHLITPPTVVVAGLPNAGKSTLLNQLVGKTAAVVSDTPGTTRDYVAQLVEIPSPLGPVIVRWLDTPGIHQSDDPIEQRAIQLSRRVIQQADVLIALATATTPGSFPTTPGSSPTINSENTDSTLSGEQNRDTLWPTTPRTPDLWVCNHHHLNPSTSVNTPLNTSPEHPLPINAKTGDNLAALMQHVIHQLGLDHQALQSPSTLWPYCPACHPDDIKSNAQPNQPNARTNVQSPT